MAFTVQPITDLGCSENTTKLKTYAYKKKKKEVMARVHEKNFKSTRLMRLIQTKEFNHQQRNKKDKKEFWCCKWL